MAAGVKPTTTPVISPTRGVQTLRINDRRLGPEDVERELPRGVSRGSAVAMKHKDERSTLPAARRQVNQRLPPHAVDPPLLRHGFSRSHRPHHQRRGPPASDDPTQRESRTLARARLPTLNRLGEDHPDESGNAFDRHVVNTGVERGELQAMRRGHRTKITDGRLAVFLHPFRQDLGGAVQVCDIADAPQLRHMARASATEKP